MIGRAKQASTHHPCELSFTANCWGVTDIDASFVASHNLSAMEHIRVFVGNFKVRGGRNPVWRSPRRDDVGNRDSLRRKGVARSRLPECPVLVPKDQGYSLDGYAPLVAGLVASVHLVPGSHSIPFGSDLIGTGTSYHLVPGATGLAFI